MRRLNPSNQRRWAAASGLLLLMATIGVTIVGQSPPSRIPFTQAQSTAGGRLYAQKCAACHGAQLTDGAAPPLAGARFMESWSAPGRTIDDLFFIIQSTMPKNEGGTLSSAEYVSVLAYILERNG